MIAESNVHGSFFTLVLCLIIVWPFFRVIHKAFTIYRPPKFKQPRWATTEKVVSPSGITEERAGYVEAKLARFRAGRK